MIRLAAGLFLSGLLLSAPLSAQQSLFHNAAIGFGGGEIADMKTRDVDNDGRADVVLLVRTQLPNFNFVYSLVTLLGNGDGSFQPPVRTSLASAGVTIALGDLDGDGRVDLAMSTANGDLETYRGSGHGIFTLISHAGGVGRFAPFALSDLDGDGKLDLVCSTSTNIDPLQALIVSHGNGDGTFGPGIAQPGTETSGINDITPGDFNGDGKIDVIESSGAEQRLALGRGDGTFAPSTRLTRNESPSAVAGDFNGDGKLDFAGVGAGTQAFVYLGDGTGGFTKRATYTVGGFSRGVAADIDGDGRADLVIAGSDVVTVMRSNGDGTFIVRSYVGSADSFPLVADFDGDHHLDVLTGLSSSILFLHGNGDGTLDAYKKFFFGSNPSSPFVLPGMYGPVTADFDGDGRTDVVVANDGLIVLLNNGDGGFGEPIPLAVLPEVSVTGLATGDVDGDGKADIVVVGSEVFGRFPRVWTYLGHGDGTFTALPPVPVEAGSIVSLADANGDGKLDILLASGFGGRLLVGNGDGTFATPVSLPGNPVIIADFNGDGRPDFATGGFDNYDVFLNRGGGAFTVAAATPGLQHALAAGDFNGDGKIDLVDSPIFDDSIRMRLGNGDGSFTNLPLLHLPQEFDGLRSESVVVADFDGDGKLDLAFGNNVLLGQGDGTFRALVRCVPSFSGTIAAADIDGNGSTDILVLDGSNHGINVLLTRTVPAGRGPIALALTRPQVHVQQPMDLTTTAATASDFIPSGSVTVTIDGVVSAFPEWDNDSATFLWIPSAAGNHQVTASFVGDDVFQPATISLVEPVLKQDSVLDFKALIAFSEQKQPTPLQATISAGETNFALAPASGAITIREGATILFTGTYNPASQPTFTYPFPTVGTHTLTLDYAGDANYAPATATLSQLVVRDTLSIRLVGNPASSLTVGQPLTLTASLSAFVAVNGGTVTFLDNGKPLGSAPATGGVASITFKPDWGQHTLSARFNGNADLDPVTGLSPLFYNIDLGPFGTPIQVRAAAITATNVHIEWSTLSGATTYDVLRHGPAGSLRIFSGFTFAVVNDDTVVPNTTYLYQVVAHNNAGAISAPGPNDWATTVPFTDDPLLTPGTTIKAAHILELRTAVNAMRAAAGLPAAIWSTDPAHAFIRATDLTELRAALAAARTALGAPVAFTDPVITPRGTTIRGIHFQEIRDAVK